MVSKKGEEKMENRRNFFRITLPNETAILTRIQTGEREKVNIYDMSGLGVSFTVSDDFWLEKREGLTIRFTLEQTTFTRQAIVVRELEKKGERAYGCKFIHTSEKEDAALSAVLFRLDAKRRK